MLHLEGEIGMDCKEEGEQVESAAAEERCLEGVSTELVRNLKVYEHLKGILLKK